MNLFILSLCFKECAEWMFDKHVSKIILEAVQMLCTAKHVLDPEHINEFPIYKSAHKNHPVTIWIRTSYDNYVWTLDLIEAMHNEWKYRYEHPADKMHKSYLVAQYLRLNPPPLDAFPCKGLTPFAQAMPNEYKEDDPIMAYRKYYQSPEKIKIATWKKRNPPPWYTLYN